MGFQVVVSICRPSFLLKLPRTPANLREMGASCSNSFLIMDHAFKSLCNYVLMSSQVNGRCHLAWVSDPSLCTPSRGSLPSERSGLQVLFTWLEPDGIFWNLIKLKFNLYLTRANFSHSLAFRTNWQCPRSLLRRADDRNGSFSSSRKISLS